MDVDINDISYARSLESFFDVSSNLGLAGSSLSFSVEVKLHFGSSSGADDGSSVKEFHLKKK